MDKNDRVAGILEWPAAAHGYQAAAGEIPICCGLFFCVLCIIHIYCKKMLYITQKSMFNAFRLNKLC